MERGNGPVTFATVSVILKYFESDRKGTVLHKIIGKSLEEIVQARWILL
jgi:hypothetical protein